MKNVCGFQRFHRREIKKALYRTSKGISRVKRKERKESKFLTDTGGYRLLVRVSFLRTAWTCGVARFSSRRGGLVGLLISPNPVSVQRQADFDKPLEIERFDQV